jgi:DHA2 family multidrug resistance protein
VYRWETRHTHPIIDFKFFKNPVIVSVLIVSFISFGGMMGALLLLPVFAQTILQYTATQSGYLFVPLGLALPIFAPLGARLASSFNPRYTVAFGMGMSALGLYMLSSLDPAMTGWDFVLPLAIFGAGLGLGLAPLTSASTNAVPINEVGMSSGLLNLARNIGGAFGIAIFSTLLADAVNSNVLVVSQNSHIIGNTPTIQAIATQLIILKADILSYEQVFKYASFAMIVGALIALFFLQTTERDDEIPPELLAEAAAG